MENQYASSTFFRKGRDGWEGKTDITLSPEVAAVVAGASGLTEGTPVLRISTHKRSAGVVTSASVHHEHDGMETFVVYQDYMKTVGQRAARCTEKTVTEQHCSALQSVPEVVADVHAHYLALTARGRRT